MAGGAGRAPPAAGGHQEALQPLGVRPCCWAQVVGHGVPGPRGVYEMATAFVRLLCDQRLQADSADVGSQPSLKREGSKACSLGCFI